MNRNPTKVFTERGLYMLATILSGERPREVTFAIRVRRAGSTRERGKTAEIEGAACR